MLAYLKGLWRRHIVGEVPVDLAACEVCRNEHCEQQNWQTCPNRLFQEEQELAHRELAGPPVSDQSGLSP